MHTMLFSTYISVCNHEHSYFNSPSQHFMQGCHDCIIFTWWRKCCYARVRKHETPQSIIKKPHKKREDQTQRFTWFDNLAYVHGKGTLFFGFFTFCTCLGYSLRQYIIHTFLTYKKPFLNLLRKPHNNYQNTHDPEATWPTISPSRREAAPKPSYWEFSSANS